ncbi:MAG: hypothetical protein ACREE6_01485 [Limisphaerales bacterium]
MDPFWNNIYDEAKDRRYGTLFIATFIILIGVLLLIMAPLNDMFADLMDVLTGNAGLSKFQTVRLLALAGALLVAIVLLGRRFVRIGRKSRRERLKYSDLSRDELLKARSKLKKDMKPVKFRIVERPGKPTTLRGPDIDLKY